MADNVDRTRLDAAVKADDGLFATYCVSSWSRYLVRPAVRLRLTPNAVTGISLAMAAIAAVWFSEGGRLAMIAGAGWLYLSFAFDCLDGQLARYTGQTSPLGAWLDAISDRVKEYLVYAGLADGYVAAGGESGTIWPLAVAAMILQTLRHMVDFSYAGSVADAGQSAASSIRATSGAHWRGHGAAYWLRRVIVLPIGERMALIAVTAAVFDARVTFLSLLSWGGLALCYTSAGRMARSVR